MDFVIEQTNNGGTIASVGQNGMITKAIYTF